MFRSIIIGNLGANAHVENNNGRPFVSFSVGHNDKFTREDGTVVERTQWISCALNGDGGKLLPFLTKGRQVYVEGRTTLRCYSSEKERRFVAGANLSVDHLELIGGVSDEVPRYLHDEQGLRHNVYKAYYVDMEEAVAVLAGRQSAPLLSAAGEPFVLVPGGWIAKEQAAPQEEKEQVEVFNGETSSEDQTLQQKLSQQESKRHAK